MASEASHYVNLEGDRVLRFDLVRFALTIPVVSSFSAVWRLGEGSGLSSVQSAGEAHAGIAVVQGVGCPVHGWPSLLTRHAETGEASDLVQAGGVVLTGV